MHYISNVGLGSQSYGETKTKGLKMQMKEYKSPKTEEQIMQDLRDGKKVKAVDMLSAMGIKVIMCE